MSDASVDDQLRNIGATCDAGGDAAPHAELLEDSVTTLPKKQLTLESVVQIDDLRPSAGVPMPASGEPNALSGNFQQCLRDIQSFLQNQSAETKKLEADVTTFCSQVLRPIDDLTCAGSWRREYCPLNVVQSEQQAEEKPIAAVKLESPQGLRRNPNLLDPATATSLPRAGTGLSCTSQDSPTIMSPGIRRLTRMNSEPIRGFDSNISQTLTRVLDADAARLKSKSGLQIPRKAIWQTTPLQTTPLRRSNSVASFRESFSNAAGKQRVFGDAEALKENIQELMTGQQTHAYDLYQKSGVCQAIARSKWFDWVTFLVVISNCAWMAYDIDCNDSTVLSEAKPIFQVVANLFCTYFVLELAVRCGAFERKLDVIHDKGFLFDLFLVIFIVLETWVLTIAIALTGARIASGNMRILGLFRTLRLLRTLRLARVLRQFPELLVIVRGISFACRAIFCVLSLLALIIYVCAIVFRVLTEGSNLGDAWFRSMPDAMTNLLVEGCLSRNGGKLIRPAVDEGVGFFVLYMAFIVLANMTMLGILTGLLVHTVKTTADVEKEAAEVQYISDQMRHVWNVFKENHDENGDEKIDLGEMEAMLQDQDIARNMCNMGVDVVAMVDVSKNYVRECGGEITFKQFMKMILDLRGKKQATVKDIVELRLCMSNTVSSWGEKSSPHNGH